MVLGREDKEGEEVNGRRERWFGMTDGRMTDEWLHGQNTGVTDECSVSGGENNRQEHVLSKASN